MTQRDWADEVAEKIGENLKSCGLLARILIVPDREKIADLLRAALSETKAVCVHKYTPYDNTWATECGGVIDDNDSDAHWKFCPYCGKPIKVKE